MVSEKVIKLLDEYVRCCLDDEYTLDARAALIAAIEAECEAARLRIEELEIELGLRQALGDTP